MTCIVALETAEGVYLGTDSFMGDDKIVDRIDRPKWFKQRNMWFGYAGSLRYAQLVEYMADFRQQEPNEDDKSYLVKVVSEGVRLTLKDADADKKDGDFLVILHGKIYILQDDWSIYRSPDGYMAIGAGQCNAVAAISACRDLVKPSKCILRALRATVYHNPFVCNRLWIRRIVEGGR